MSDAARFPPAGTCWFCGRRPGATESLTFPFWSNRSDEIRILVVPRCGACESVHRGQQLASLAILGACAFVPALLVRLAPVSEGVQTALTVVAFIAGGIAGVVLVAWRERQRAAALGTKPAHGVMEHPEYEALNADSEGWRQRSGPGMSTGDGINRRRETVAECRRFFANDAKALAALEQGCRDAGVPAA